MFRPPLFGAVVLAVSFGVLVGGATFVIQPWNLARATTLVAGESLPTTDLEVMSLDERAEAERLAPKYEAEVEVRLWDSTRCDLLNDTYAIEVDWAPKWAEAIGQSLYYAELTGKSPAILLLVRDITTEQRYVYRCQTVCADENIKLYIEQVPAAATQ